MTFTATSGQVTRSVPATLIVQLDCAWALPDLSEEWPSLTIPRLLSSCFIKQFDLVKLFAVECPVFLYTASPVAASGWQQVQNEATGK